MDNIIVAFNVIAPVLFLMVIGYVLVNYTNLADRNLTKKANAIVFKIFLPCMLFSIFTKVILARRLAAG